MYEPFGLTRLSTEPHGGVAGTHTFLYRNPGYDEPNHAAPCKLGTYSVHVRARLTTFASARCSACEKSRHRYSAPGWAPLSIMSVVEASTQAAQGTVLCPPTLAFSIPPALPHSPPLTPLFCRRRCGQLPALCFLARRSWLAPSAFLLLPCRAVLFSLTASRPSPTSLFRPTRRPQGRAAPLAAPLRSPVEP